MANVLESQSAGVLELQQARLCVLDENGIKSFVPIEDQIAFFVMTQDLFEPSIRINFQIVDALGHLTRFNKAGYQGQEFVQLRCKKPGEDGQQIDLQFWIHDISEIGGNFKNDGSSYNLTGITKEKLISTYSDVNQAFNSTYSEAANSIFTNYITKDTRKKKLFKKYEAFSFEDRKLNVHDSVVENQFIIPGHQPFKAIEMCARRAMGRKGSNTKSTSLYTFYETIDGYNFHCIDDLIREGKSKHPDPDLTFEYEPQRERKEGTAEPSGKRFDRKIRDIISLKTSDNLFNGNAGTLKNQVLIVDAIGKTYKKRVFDYNAEFKDLPHLGDTQLVDKDYVNAFVRPSYEHMYIQDSTKSNQFFDQVLSVRTAYTLQLHNLQMTFVIEGDTSIKPGMVLDIKLPELSAITENITERYSTKFSGFWLVSTVVHEYTRDAFHTTISCLKDSIKEAIGQK